MQKEISLDSEPPSSSSVICRTGIWPMTLHEFVLKGEPAEHTVGQAEPVRLPLPFFVCDL